MSNIRKMLGLEAETDTPEIAIPEEGKQDDDTTGEATPEPTAEPVATDEVTQDDTPTPEVPTEDAAAVDAVVAEDESPEVPAEEEPATTEEPAATEEPVPAQEPAANAVDAIPEDQVAADVDVPTAVEEPVEAAPVDTDSETQLPEMVQEADDQLEAGEEVAQTIVTLESIAQILEDAPEGQLNETTTLLVSAIGNDIAQRYEMQVPALATESITATGPAVYRSAALEDIRGKLQAFQDSLKKIQTYIVDLLQRIWEWITDAYKSYSGKLVDLSRRLNEIKGNPTLELPNHRAYSVLMTESSPHAISEYDKNLATIKSLVNASAIVFTAFVADVAAARAWRGVRYQDFDKAFHAFKKNDGEFEFYDNIGGHSARVEMATFYSGVSTKDSKTTARFNFVMGSAASKLEAVDTVKGNKASVVKLAADARDLAARIEALTPLLRKTRNSMRAVNVVTLAASTGQSLMHQNLMHQNMRKLRSVLKLLNGVNGAIVAPAISSIRAVLILGNAWVKEAEAAEQATATANAPRLASA